MATQKKKGNVNTSQPSLRGTKQSHDVNDNNKQIANKSVIARNEAISSKEPKKLVPKLRFKEFEDEWEQKKLGEISKLITKGTTPKKFTEKGINYVKIQGLDGININKEKCLYIDKAIHEGELKRSILEENDLLFAIAGATIGKIGIVTNEILPANTNQALAIIRLKSTDFLEFTLQILQSRIMKKYISESISVGAQPNLNLEQMGNFKFFQPKLPEQQKIANFLTAVDTKLQQLTTKKETLAQYKKGVMQQLFNQQLRFKPDVIARTQDEAISSNETEFPDWEEKRLGEVFKFKQGFQFPVEEQFDEPFENSVYFIRIVNVTSSPDDKRYVIKPEEQHILSKNDLFMVRYGDAGRIATGFNGIIANNMFRLLPKMKISEKWFYFYLDSIYEKIHALAGSSTMPAIKFGTIENLKVDTPSLKEQQKIANYLSAIDLKIETVQTQLSKTQAFKKGLLQAMFV